MHLPCNSTSPWVGRHGICHAGRKRGGVHLTPPHLISNLILLDVIFRSFRGFRRLNPNENHWDCVLGRKLRLQGEVQRVCWSMPPCCVDSQPRIVSPSRQALRLLWQLGRFWKFYTLIRRMSDPEGKNKRERRGGKGIEEVFVSCLWFVFSTKTPQNHQSEWFTLLGMNRVSTLLFVFCMVLCALQHHPLGTSHIK